MRWGTQQVTMTHALRDTTSDDDPCVEGHNKWRWPMRWGAQYVPMTHALRGAIRACDPCVERRNTCLWPMRWGAQYVPMTHALRGATSVCVAIHHYTALQRAQHCSGHSTAAGTALQQAQHCNTPPIADNLSWQYLVLFARIIIIILECIEITCDIK